MKHTFRYRVGSLAPGTELTLGAEDSHHLARVVRRVSGDAIELIDAEGRLWPATVVQPGPPALVAVADVPREGPASLPIDLAVGLAEWGRLDTLVEKATEFGVASITIFASSRARRVPDADSFAARRSRLARVADAAARQSGRAGGVAIGDLATIESVLGGCDPTGTFLVDPRGEQALGAAVAAQAGRRVTLVVGPDAGFSHEEIDRARGGGVAIAHLGDATLRTETAAIVAAVIAAGALGALERRISG